MNAGWLAHEALAVAWLLLPLPGAAALHSAVIRFDWFTFLKLPIDAGRTLRGQPVFGANKTWRGIAAVGTGCALVFMLQADVLHAFAPFRALEVFDYGEVNAQLFGFTLGVAAELAELPNSFIKRRSGIGPGMHGHGSVNAVFFVLDQVDVLLGYWLVLACVMPPHLLQIAISLVLVLVLHPVLGSIGVLLGVRKSAR